MNLKYNHTSLKSEHVQNNVIAVLRTWEKYNHISLEIEHFFLIDMKEGYTVFIHKSKTGNQ
jgi:hypothetical protein